MSRRGGKTRTKRNPYNCGNDRMFWQSQNHNMRLVSYYRNIIMQMAMSRFKWINLPESCDERFLEYTLLTEGVASIAFPKKMKGTFFSTKCVFESIPNVYDNYSKWKSIGNNGWQFYANPTQGTLVWDNNTRFPLMVGIELYAQELAHVRITKEMNRFHQQIPFILKGPKEKINDMQQLMKQVAGGELAILALDGLDSIEATALMTQVPYIGDKLAQDEANIWNSVFTMLGVPNTTLKMERQTVDEVRAQKAPTGLVKLASLDTRRTAAEYLNTHFSEYLPYGNIDVVVNEDFVSDNYNLINSIRDMAEMDILEGDANG